MVDGAEDLLWKDILRNEVFPDCSSKVQKEVQLQQISKQESDFQVGQEVWNSWHLWRSKGNRLIALWASNNDSNFRQCHSGSRVSRSENAFDITVDIWSMYSRTLLDILFLIWGQTVADYKMLSFHLSINVIIIVVSFKILDLCPIALFQQL